MIWYNVKLVLNGFMINVLENIRKIFKNKKIKIYIVVHFVVNGQKIN